MRIVDLNAIDERCVSEAAALLMDGFAESGSASWTTLEAARLEVGESLQERRISRVALDEAGAVLGWVGGISSYGGHAWELHPLVVRGDYRRRGVGRALVADLEEQVRRRGAMTLYVGTDDENGSTSLGGRDLYPDPLRELVAMRNLDHHPFEFYVKMGFVVTGVIPDANGLGKPDIFLAKRVGYTPAGTRSANQAGTSEGGCVEKDYVAKASVAVDAPAETVWRALVTPDAVRQYMFGTTVISDWQVGRPIVWKGEWHGKQYEDKGTILRHEPPRVLEYTHFSPLSGAQDVPENYHTVTIQLEPHGTQTRVVLAQNNNPTDQQREEYEKNWTMMLSALKQFVEQQG